MMDDFDDADIAAVFDSTGGSRPSTLTSDSSRDRREQAASKPHNTGVVQPKPQSLPQRTGPSSILVSPRQKGNPILNGIRALPWEYSDIPADYVLGATTCALFLSLKYHRLHPEYIYSRITQLKGKYNLRVILTMVDVQNHEESVKELSKTSLINNVTIILCWSAQEAGRYLELFKSYEHATPTAIKAHQSTSYSQKLVDFVTVPRSINKTDAVGLVSSFGSLRTAINASPEEVALVGGWGDKKVQRWCNTVRDNFRVQKAAKRGVAPARVRLSAEATKAATAQDPAVAARLGIGSGTPASGSFSSHAQSSTATPANVDRDVSEQATVREPDEDEEEAMLQAFESPSVATPMSKKPLQNPSEDGLSEGISAALAKLRRQG